MSDTETINGRLLPEHEKAVSLEEHLELAIQNHMDGKLTEAEYLCQGILHADPNHSVALHLLGVIYYQLGKNRPAADLLSQALTLCPDSAELHNNLALVKHAVGKFDDAVTLYQEAISIMPGYMEAHNNLGITFQELGCLNEAQEHYEKAISINPNYANAYSNLGNLFNELGKFDDAIYQLKKALLIKPDLAGVYFNLGIAFHQSGLLENAAESYQKVLVSDPNSYNAHINLGSVFQELGRLDKATAHYNKALAIKDDSVDAYSNLANALAEQGKLDQAVEFHKKAIAIDPDSAEEHYNFGNTLKKLNNLKGAAAEYQKAIKVKPEYTDARNNLGLVLYALGDLTAARAEYLSILKNNPDYADAYSNLAIMLNASGHRLEAMDFYKKRMDVARGYNKHNRGQSTFSFTTRTKILHDIEQFKYLASIGHKKSKFISLAKKYKLLEQEISWPDDKTAQIRLSDRHLKILRETYNRPLNLLKAPEVVGSSINKAIDVKKITSDYFSETYNKTYFDEFLTQETLCSLRNFLLGSTIWFDFNYKGGYLGAMLHDGLACPLLLQIASDLRHTFPEIFKNHQLTQLWAYKYDSQLNGISTHADFAAVNVNFWITPNAANLNPKSGGLVIYDAEAPLDWNFKSYNNDQIRIKEFLAEKSPMKTIIPYSENRIVLFNSNLFHETDRFKFKKGYQNRRINITMLFGTRDGLF